MVSIKPRSTSTSTSTLKKTIKKTITAEETPEITEETELPESVSKKRIMDYNEFEKADNDDYLILQGSEEAKRISVENLLASDDDISKVIINDVEYVPDEEGTINITHDFMTGDHTHDEYALVDHIHDGYIMLDEFLETKEEINGKADMDHVHDEYALNGHAHSEYALNDHEHKGYLTEHQDISYLASNSKVNKLVTYLYNRLVVLEDLVRELGGEVPDGGDLPIDPEEPTEPENPGEEPDLPFDPDEPVVPEGERFILEYTIEPFGSEPVSFNSERNYTESGYCTSFIPTIYTTSDSFYIPTSKDITITLNDGTTTNDLNTKSKDVRKISILYDSSVYKIVFRRISSSNVVRNYNRVKNILQINTSNFRTMESMFSNCKYLENINMDNFYTNKVMSMGDMFYNCSSLKSLDVSKWDTSIVKYMGNMFYGCSSLRSLDLSNFDVTLCTDFVSMFYNCKSLTNLNVTGWNLERSNALPYMFYGCSSLISLDLSSWNVDNISSIKYLFEGCSSLRSIDISNWNTNQMKYMGRAFYNCSSLSNIIGIEVLDVSNVTDMNNLFYNTGIVELDLTNWNVSNLSYLYRIFDNNLKLEKLNLSTWNLPKINSSTTQSRIFADCMVLRELNIYGFIKNNSSLSNCLSNNMLLNVNLDCVITIPNDEKIIALFDQYYPEYTYVYQD